MTGKIVAKADRGADPFTYIDDIRQEVFEIGEWKEAVEKRLKILEDNWRDRPWVTETGVWPIVKAKLEEETIDWMKWGIRAFFCGVGAFMLSGVGWVISRIFH